MISFRPKLTLKTFVALAITFFIVGFVGIIVLGYGAGDKLGYSFLSSDENKKSNSTNTNGSSAGQKDTVTQNSGTNDTSTSTNQTNTSQSGTGSSTSTTNTTNTSTTSGSGGTSVPAPTPTPTPSPAPTYCGGRATCYGRSDLAAHTTSKSCWGYVYNVMFDITPLINSHSGGPTPIENTCGKDILAAVKNAQNNSKHRAIIGSTSSSNPYNTSINFLSGYKNGYYDPTKP